MMTNRCEKLATHHPRDRTLTKQTYKARNVPHKGSSLWCWVFVATILAISTNLVVMSVPSQSLVLLEPSKPLTIGMSPYELRDIFIPVEKLSPDTDYWIKSSFGGGHAVEIIMKRKAAQPDPHLSEDSDYMIRYARQHQGLRLRDHRYPSEFTLSESKRYQDDLEGTKYEILETPQTSYLVFALSMVERAYSFDEANSLQKIDVTLTLMPNSLDSFSEVGSFWVSCAATCLVLGLFIAIVYFFVLPKDVRGLLIGEITTKKPAV